MKIKKILVVTATVTAVTGAVFGAYKFGEFVGRNNEKEKAEEEALDAINKNKILTKENTTLRIKLLGQETNRDEIYKSEIDRAEARIATLTERTQRLTDKISEKNSENRSLRAEKFDFESQNHRLQAEIKILNEKLEQGEFYGKDFSQRDYLQALWIICTNKKATTRLLMDEVKIPYKSAVALLKYLESRKLISVHSKGKAREIFFDENFVKTEWAAHGASLDEMLPQKGDEPSIEEASSPTENDDIYQSTDSVHSPVGNEQILKALEDALGEIASDGK